MNPEYKANLLRILQPLLTILVGTLLTAAAFLFAGFASSTCQCSSPIAIAFPFATILWSLRRWESVGGVLMAFQFPVYCLLIAFGRTHNRQSRYALIVLAVHVAAVVLGLLMYRG